MISKILFCILAPALVAAFFGSVIMAAMAILNYCGTIWSLMFCIWAVLATLAALTLVGG